METILIKNGRIFDPAEGTFTTGSITVKGTKIIETEDISPDITIDAARCIVSPGLIDAHLHINDHGSDGGVPADLATLPNGVTTAVDVGSCGESNYRIMRNYHIIPAAVRIKTALNISSAGLATTRFPENLNPVHFAEEKIQALFEEFPEDFAGLKIRMSRGIVAEGDITPLKAALSLADKIDTILIVHITNPAVPCETIAEMLRPGDIICHCFQGTGDTILDNNNTIKPGILKAREKGVLFDACHGRVNFNLNIAKAALEQNFLPDIISTDHSPKNLFRSPVVSIPRLVSKFAALGMPLEEVLRRVTLFPARMLGMEDELASLQPGTTADIAVFRTEKRRVVFSDFQGRTMEGDSLLTPLCTIKNGRLLYAAADIDIS